MASTSSLSRHLSFFFEEHLIRQRGASRHTVLAYRDAIKAFLAFGAEQKKCDVSALDVADLGADVVLAFLEYLEATRGRATATRNARLTALRSFFRVVASRDPLVFELCQRILLIPQKRAVHRVVDYLEKDEIDAILKVIGRHAIEGRRDYALFAFMYNTGARISEALALNARDLQLDRPAHARVLGKGRKERICPLWIETARSLRHLLRERGIAENAEKPVFVSRRGVRLTRDGAAYLLRKYVKLATANAPTLASKKVHPHVLRHTTGMHMVRAGDDRSVIADFLGHASMTTTARYARADLEVKRRAIEAVAPIPATRRAISRREDVLAFLESL